MGFADSHFVSACVIKLTKRVIYRTSPLLKCLLVNLDVGARSSLERRHRAILLKVAMFEILLLLRRLASRRLRVVPGIDIGGVIFNSVLYQGSFKLILLVKAHTVVCCEICPIRIGLYLWSVYFSLPINSYNLIIIK